MDNDDTTTPFVKRPIGYWGVTVFMSLSVVLLVLGQSMALLDYDFTVRLGMQEDIKKIGDFGVQINRAFAAGDTLIYIPLTVASIIGLCMKKKWALLTSAAVMGISTYWATTAAFAFWFLDGVPGYSFVPGVDYWIFISSYIVFGIWGIYYLIYRGEYLI